MRSAARVVPPSGFVLRALVGRLALALALVVVAGACGGGALSRTDPLAALRSAAEGSNDGEVVGRWLFGELVAPGGDPARARAARARLEKLPNHNGMYASMARAIDDEAHGRFKSAATANLDALAAARTSASPDAPIVAWFAANYLLRLRGSVQGLWDKARDLVLQTIDMPGNIGWRARGELVEWWSVDGLRDRAAAASREPERASLLDVAAKRFGCIDHARLAGPFGHLAPNDDRTHYDAERPGPWPYVFAKDARRMQAPRIIATERRGCQLRATDPVGPGVYYVESFVDLNAERDLIVAVQGAYALFIDDVEVLTRDSAAWGVWPRFGAHVRLQAGRHRLLARLGAPETSVRVLTSGGTPLDVPSSIDPTPLYTLAAPGRLPDPNALEPFLQQQGVRPQPGTPRPRGARDLDDPIARYLAAYLAHVEGQDDVADVLIEPLVKDSARATGLALGMHAVFVEKDPIFPENDARDLAKDVRARAASKDAELWWPRLWLVLDQADKVGLPEVAAKIMELADHFREVPDIIKGLAQMYGRIGWKAERAKVIREAAVRFPDDAEVLRTLLTLYDEQGKLAEADQVAARIRKLDPDAEVDFERALARRDYKAAIRELERLGNLRKDRKDIALRIADMLTRAGASGESMEKLERALAKNPNDATARLALADARFAAGDRSALRKALVDAVHSGAETNELRDAIELVDGVTELSGYRQDTKKVIADYEATAQKTKDVEHGQKAGTAERVLDYSAMWIHGDGSARMLEHEIICVQTREAIQEHAEQQVPRGLVLKLRTIKRDGRILEPEFVEGKPTVTMPHLDIGDYIETESIYTIRSDGQGGRTFVGPRWFFREEKLAYWRSEFVVISPKNRPLVIETGGSVPKPEVVESGAVVTRRWRVDHAPAVPEEPGSAPIQEFLPNVRVGWGVSLDDTIARMVDGATDLTPRDPRLVRIADTIARAPLTVDGAKRVEAAPAPSAAATSTDDRARRVYHWVLANVEQGRETDPRRIVLGKSGNRTEAFVYLCKLLGIDASLGVLRDRLAPPPTGPLSEVETFTALAVRIGTEKGPRWMMVRDKYAPYAYLPSSLRGQPAVVLRPGAPRETTPTTGAQDGIVYEGTAELAADGSAKIDLEQRFEGKFAIALRSALETLPDAQLRETVEARLLPQALPGARLERIVVKDLADLDAPITLSMKIQCSNFARPRGAELVIAPPFPVALGNLVALPSRETPLYLSEQISTKNVVKLRIKLPTGARVASALGALSAADGDRIVSVNDHVDHGALLLDRVIDLPAGRVQPDAYAKFQDFARRGDAALHREILIALGGGARGEP